MDREVEADAGDAHQRAVDGEKRHDRRVGGRAYGREYGGGHGARRKHAVEGDLVLGTVLAAWLLDGEHQQGGDDHGKAGDAEGPRIADDADQPQARSRSHRLSQRLGEREDADAGSPMVGGQALACQRQSQGPGAAHGQSVQHADHKHGRHRRRDGVEKRADHDQQLGGEEDGLLGKRVKGGREDRARAEGGDGEGAHYHADDRAGRAQGAGVDGNHRVHHRLPGDLEDADDAQRDEGGRPNARRGSAGGATSAHRASSALGAPSGRSGLGMGAAPAMTSAA